MFNRSLSRTAVVRATLFAGAALTLALAAAPAGAQKLTNTGIPVEDPLLEESEWDARPGQFFINNNEEVEVIRFKTVHDMQTCAGAAHRTADGRVRGYAIKVSWDAESAVVQPGNCLAFDAKVVKVRAASPLPDDIILTGAIKVLK